LPVPAGLFLASPAPPSMLTYDLAALDAGGRACPVTLGHHCVGNPLLLATLALPPPVVIDVPPERGLRMVVSIPQQKLYVFRDGDLLTTSQVSTGKRGHGTPTGTFRILQKAIKHRSTLYSDAPMPYMQRLTQGGVALHAGHVPGYPSSHGCIRLPMAMANKLYKLTNFSTTSVTVTGEKPRSAEDAFKLVETIQVVQRPRPVPAIVVRSAPTLADRPAPQLSLATPSTRS
jgi:lipoprotein-anchoring transpeptidase ErfK/SrfK